MADETPDNQDKTPPIDQAAQGDVTRLLVRIKDGDAAAHEEFLPLVYEHLKSLAASQLRGRERTLQPTALVHELFLRLIGGAASDFRSRGHFMAVAATAMRQILIDHARKGGAAKRGGDRARVSLSDVRPGEVEEQALGAGAVDVIALHDALERLAALDPRQARLVELRVFGGMSQNEVAEVLGVSLRTVERDWRRVRAWLARELAVEE